MAQITRVRLKMERGRMVLQSLKHTTTGQSYVAATTVFDALSIHDPSFKTEIPLAVDRLFSADVEPG